MEERGLPLNKPDDDDLNKIIVFLDWRRSELDAIKRLYDFLVPEHPALAQELTKDWPTIVKSFEDTKIQLQNYPESLIQHGLTSQQLDLKLQLIKAISRILMLKNFTISY